MTRPTWLIDISADEYHAATKRNEFTTSHRLNLFRRCPALYKKTIDGKIVEGDTASFMLGRATHTLVLEGEDACGSQYLVSDGPTNEKTGKPYGKATKAYAEWAEAQSMPVISTEDNALMCEMSVAVHAHPVAADLIKSGFAEGTIRSTWNGEPVQARLDWYDPERNILVDLKTCSDADRFRFDVRDFGYVEQMAFYANMLTLAGAPLPETYLIAVEKKEPFRVVVVNVVEMTLNDANRNHLGSEKWRDDNDAMIEELKHCRETGVWPTRYEKVVHI